MIEAKLSDLLNEISGFIGQAGREQKNSRRLKRL
jgi:hypothetical protein